MDGDSRLPFILAILLLLCAAYFAVAETAFASASRNKIKTAADRGDSRAETALYVLDHFDRAISTLLIGTNIVHIAAASLVTVAVTRLWGLNAVSISTIVTTIVVFFAGEMLPKSIAKKYPERLCKATAPSLRFFMLLFWPVSSLLTLIGRGAAALTKGDPEISVTEDELYDIIEDMTEEGSLDEEQGDLISSALQFGEVTVESILTPRVDLEAIDIEDSLEEILSQVKSQNHSRLPVYEKSVDNIIGILQIRRFIKAYLRQKQDLELRALLDSGRFELGSHTFDLHGLADRRGCAAKPGESAEAYRAALLADDARQREALFSPLGASATVFAFPYGAFGADTRRILSACGYTLFLTCEEKINEISPGEPLTALGRINRPASVPTAAFMRRHGI